MTILQSFIVIEIQHGCQKLFGDLFGSKEDSDYFRKGKFCLNDS